MRKKELICNMHITFTDSAKEKLAPYEGGAHGVLRLVFDSEGCGCAMNGVPSLWLVSEAEPKDLQANAEPFKVYFSPQHEVFFEDELKIDFHIGKKSYILKSNSQIYNAGMDLIDKR
jgi:uncharacterized protein YqkB